MDARLPAPKEHSAGTFTMLVITLLLLSHTPMKLRFEYYDKNIK